MTSSAAATCLGKGMHIPTGPPGAGFRVATEVLAVRLTVTPSQPLWPHSQAPLSLGPPPVTRGAAVWYAAARRRGPGPPLAAASESQEIQVPPTLARAAAFFPRQAQRPETIEL